ncbi:MAG: hypothetical protein LBJ16_01440 [Holosporaceae bacterium]|jgi:hypothetical protein|nr:hypothetical protein [Holosporaceae bacterium]
MIPSRGIRSLSEGYIRDFCDAPDTEENVKHELLLETESDENYNLKPAVDWPTSISLNACINFQKINASTIVERVENAKSLGQSNIYKTSTIDDGSPLKKIDFFCSKIIIEFENSGEYISAGTKHGFFGKIFDDYQLNFGDEIDLEPEPEPKPKSDLDPGAENKTNVLFEKFFHNPKNEHIVEKYTSAHGGFLQEEGAPGKAKVRIYPYGGFCEYGAHPKNMELCVFQTKANAKTTLIRIHRLSALIASGVDPFCESIMSDGTPFVGIVDLQESQKNNLYDDLKSGRCQIMLTDAITQDSQHYKSAGLTQIPDTNLITINFLRKNTP